MQYPESLDNYDIEVFNKNFIELAEKSRAVESNLASEISRAKAAEKSNADNITAESDRAATRESAIENSIVEAVQNFEDAINAAKSASNSYTNQKIAELINGAPSTLDTLKEIADAISENESVADTLNSAIGTKASNADLTAHTGDTKIHVTESEKTKWNGVANPTFTTAETRGNIASGESLNTLFGKIKKWFTDLKQVAFSGSWNDLSDTPTIPEKVSQLENDSKFVKAANCVPGLNGAPTYSTLVDFWTAADNLFKTNSTYVGIIRFKDGGGWTPVNGKWWRAIVSAQNLLANNSYEVTGAIILFTQSFMYFGSVSGGKAGTSDLAVSWKQIDTSTVILSATLSQGATNLSFTNAAIKTTSLVDIYTDTYGLYPKAASIDGNVLNITFDAQSKDVLVKVKVVKN